MDWAKFSREAHGYESRVEGALIANGEVGGGHVAVIKKGTEYRALTASTDTENRETHLSVTAAADAEPAIFERPDSAGTMHRHVGVAVYAGEPVNRFVYVDPEALGLPVLAPSSDEAL